jgi:CubicO group peptidase (beta-lactamase class C family)
MNKIRACIAMFLLTGPLLALAQPAGKTEAPLSPSARMDKLFDFWNRQDQPGFAVVVVKDGRVLYQKAMGLACQEQQAAITPGTLFNLGQAAEPFTGLAIALLEKQGKLSLDDDVRKHIPELPDFGTPVRLADLLYQTSGLRDWLAVVDLTGRDMEEITIDKVIKIVQAQKALAFKPGERFQDSNTNYDLLAEVVKRITGKPFSDWVWENVFKPLKMTRSQFRDDFRSVLDDQALSYNFTRQEYKRGVDTLSLAGSHSLYASIGELAKWLTALETGQLGGPELWERIFTPGKLSTGASSGFGYGLNVIDVPGRKQVFRVGTWAGSGAVLYYFPDRKFGFAVLSNWDYTSTDGFIPGIIEIYLPPPAPPVPAAKSAAKTKAVKVSPRKLDALVGDYRIAPGRVFSIARTGDQLFVVIPGAKFPLTAASETVFRLDIAEATVTFHMDKAGRATEFVWDQGGEQVAPRVVLVHPTPQELQEYVGEYANDELGSRFRVELRGAALFLVSPGLGDVRLAPDERDRFSSGSRAVPMVVFQRDAQSRLTGFIIDNDPVRDLVFKRS